MLPPPKFVMFIVMKEDLTSGPSACKAGVLSLNHTPPLLGMQKVETSISYIFS